MALSFFPEGIYAVLFREPASDRFHFLHAGAGMHENVDDALRHRDDLKAINPDVVYDVCHLVIGPWTKP